jgi:hypothetical protein
VLDGADDDLATPSGLERLGRTTKGQIVGLGPVKITSDPSPPSRAATEVRASSIALLACCPKLCTLDALPATSRSARLIASTTASAGGVVAL